MKIQGNIDGFLNKYDRRKLNMTFETILKIIIAFSNNIFNLLVIVFFYSASNYNVKKEDMPNILLRE